MVSIDFETRSASDLRRTGVYKYAEDASTDIWCMAYQFPDEDEVHVWQPGDPIDQSLSNYIQNGGALRAWNANFERVIWHHIMAGRYGWPKTSIKQWHCTMAQASAMGLPRSLGQAAAVLGVAEQKDKTGQALMLRMARPRRINEDGSYVWWTEPKKLQALIDYCRQDVRTEVAIAEQLAAFSDNERQVFMLDQRINDRGICLDVGLVRRVKELAETSSEKLDAEMQRLTKGAVKKVTNGMDLVAWLNAHGIKTASVAKDVVTGLLARSDLHPVIRKVLELRQAGAKSSTAKLDAMLDAVNADGRMRGLLVYHGAATGRWSGKLVQPQNFPRPAMKQDKIDECIARLGRGESVAEFGAGTQIAADLLRSMLVAAPGNRLIFADYNAIEARVLAWMAGQKDLVEQFNKNEGVYEDMAAVVYGVSPEEIGKDSAERFVGKSLVLGCGYGMSGKRFSEFAKVDLDLALRAVAAYREKNDRIVQYWRRAEEEFVEAAYEAIRNKEPYLTIPLPSGRRLHYHNPRIVERETPWGAMKPTAQVDTLNSMTRQWTSQLIWGGLVVENIVQATARDLMATAMMRLELGGYPVIASVHDEIICEVPEDHGSVEQMVEIMTALPGWAQGCPLAAEGKEGARYRK